MNMLMMKWETTIPITQPQRLWFIAAELDGAPLPGSPEDFGKLVARETEKKAKIIKASGVKLD